MNDLQINKAEEITNLHNEIIGLGKTVFDKAIRIGELLTEQKASLKHGEFGNWIDANLPFTDRTARNYMRLHENRKQLKTENVSELSEAYKILSGEDNGYKYYEAVQIFYGIVDFPVKDDGRLKFDSMSYREFSDIGFKIKYMTKEHPWKVGALMAIGEHLGYLDEYLKGVPSDVRKEFLDYMKVYKTFRSKESEELTDDEIFKLDWNSVFNLRRNNYGMALDSGRQTFRINHLLGKKLGLQKAENIQYLMNCDWDLTKEEAEKLHKKLYDPIKCRWNPELLQQFHVGWRTKIINENLDRIRKLVTDYPDMVPDEKKQIAEKFYKTNAGEIAEDYDIYMAWLKQVSIEFFDKKLD
jgi:hypothetical protein